MSKLIVQYYIRKDGKEIPLDISVVDFSLIDKKGEEEI
jgi:hypothetical protein